MAGKEGLNDGAGGSSCSNVFSNDGSFLEKFRKMQQEKEEAEKKASTVKLPPLLKPGMKVLSKRKSLTGQKPPQHSSDNGSRIEQESPPDLKKLKETPSDSFQKPVSENTAVISSQASSSSNEVGVSNDPPKRKRKSRWGDAPSMEDQQMAAAMSSFTQPVGTQQLTQEQQRQLLEQQEMNRLVLEVQTAAKQRRSGQSRQTGAHAEDVAIDAWQKEHSLRAIEMEKTLDKSVELTEAGKGKHFIGDFLPPDELAKFMEKVKAIKEGRNPDLSDYAEHKIDQDNVGYQLLQKAGWKEGAGLGKEQEGITAPINKGKQTFDQAGLGANPVGEVSKEDDQFELYRKRMMLAYRFRPNPLNNPRRPYY